MKPRVVSLIATASIVFAPYACAVTDAEFHELQDQLHAALTKQQDLQQQINAIKAGQVKTTSAGKIKNETPKTETKRTTPAKANPAPERKVGEKALDIDLDKLKGNPVTLQDISDAFDVPDSPAANVLGVASDKIQHVTTPKQLVPAVINGLDEHGHFQSGLALDFAPYQWLKAKSPISDFREGRPGIFGGGAPTAYFERVLLRTQLSFATTKGASDADKSSKIAFGIHSVLMNADDPLMTADAFKGDDNAVLEINPNTEKAQSLDAFGRSLNHWVLGKKELEERVPAESTTAHVVHALWSHSSWAVGAAPKFIAEDESSSYRYAGTTAWSSFAYVPSREMPFRLVLDAVYQNGEQILVADAIGGASAASAIGAKDTITQDSLLLIGGVRVGNRDFNATFTGAWLELDQHGLGHDQAFRYAIEAEKRVSTNTWVTLTVSKDEGHNDGRNPVLVLGGVKIGLGGRDFTTEGQTARAKQEAANN